jgi:hypothetical protein
VKSAGSSWSSDTSKQRLCMLVHQSALTIEVEMQYRKCMQQPPLQEGEPLAFCLLFLFFFPIFFSLPSVRDVQHTSPIYRDVVRLKHIHTGSSICSCPTSVLRYGWQQTCLQRRPYMPQGWRFPEIEKLCATHSFATRSEFQCRTR